MHEVALPTNSPTVHARRRVATVALLVVIVAAAAVTMAIAAAPWLARRRGPHGSRLDVVVAGIRDAQLAARHPSWRLGGAVGYLAFDIAVLWATFSAVGHPPPAPALTLAYAIGYLANALPVPGG